MMNGFVIVAIFAGIVGLLWWSIAEENREHQAFYQNCLSIPKSEKECKMLLSIKESADDAQMMSGVAIGLAAGSQAGK